MVFHNNDYRRFTFYTALMARKITAPFTLTESISLDTVDSFVQDTVDISSYISVGSRQALQVHSVDFIYQSTDANDVVHNVFSAFNTALTAGVDTGILLQLTDLNRGEMVLADDSALMASGQLRITPAGDYHASDLYPDEYRGPEGRTVVNDQIYFGAKFHGAAIDVGATLQVTARIECQIVELDVKSWMSIALQSTAADN